MRSRLKIDGKNEEANPIAISGTTRELLTTEIHSSLK